MIWKTTRFDIDLARPKVMGIVNVTPDSFSDGGEFYDRSAALAHCDALVGEGADLLDIGGESTRPGSPPVPADEELKRILPVVRHALTLRVPVSVDTNKAEVMRAVLDLGVDIVNDIWALRQPGAADVVAGHPRCGACLMHMHGEPATMQVHPMAGDALPAVRGFLAERAAVLVHRGVAHERIVLDPGIGFGKTVAQNFALLAHQRELIALGFPLLVGWSRKSSIGAALQGHAPTPSKPHDRVMGSVAAALLAVERGARVVRVHDVLATVQALAVWRAASESATAPALA